MNITGIITEYNPFHNGHEYHLEKAKSSTDCDGVICIMSGNFVQRGEPAIIDKWQRTSMALKNGVDLIIELPTYYALSSAEFFAEGSVSILNALGVVNNIFFGSESGDIDLLSTIAKTLVLEDPSFKSLLKAYLNKGLTFAKARELALIEFLNNETLTEILSSSNNILGIEYLKALFKLNSTILPKTLKREGANYNEKNLTTAFASATSIREAIKSNKTLNNLDNFMPKPSLELFTQLQEKEYPFVFSEDMFKFIKLKLLTNCINFNNLSEAKEGLDNKLLKEIITSNSYDQFIFNIKSKRYTYTKISRLLTQIFIGFDNNTFKSIDINEHLYARVLGFNKKGRDMLSIIKQSSSIPLITKIPKHTDNPLLLLDIQATKAYSILNNKVDPRSDYLISPIINL